MCELLKAGRNRSGSLEIKGNN